MALQPIIRLGDKTTHGGTVLEGFSTYSLYGIPVSGLGHKVFCPLCKGAFPIVECISTHTVDGVGVSVQGMKTGCGATLIASQGTALLEFSGGGSFVAGSGANKAGSVISYGSNSRNELHDEQFQLLDAEGQPLSEARYKIVTASGSAIEGVTDSEGKTQRVKTPSAEQLNIYLIS